MMPAISEFIAVRSRYLRAVNLSADTRDVHSLEGLILTPLFVHTLDRILLNLESPQGERCFMLYGPYGSGKSTFGLFMHELFKYGANKNSFACTRLREKDVNLSKRFGLIGRRRWFCVPVTARRSAIGQILLEALLRTMSDLPRTPGKETLAAQMAESLEQGTWTDSGLVLNFVEKVYKLTSQNKRGGMLLVVDEAGKSLEYALQDRAGGDVYLFQMLAEFARRQTGIPFLFVTVQHQQFDGYTELGNSTLRHEWAKVQERFETLSFNQQLAAGLNTLALLLDHIRPLPSETERAITDEAQKILAAGASLPPGMSAEEFLRVCHNAWPLHPSVVLVLPLLFSRLAQNERSLFSWLGSQEVYGFQDHCRKDIGEDHGFVRLHHIADYLLTNMAITLAQRPAARILLESLNSETSITEQQQQLLCTIGLLSMAGSGSPLRASEAVLSVALGGNVPANLVELRRKELITYRPLDQCYYLWEGGLIDLEDLLQQARVHLRCEGVAFVELVRQHVQIPPIMARKHHLQSGACRFFNLAFASGPEDLGHKPGTTSCEAGTVQVLMPMNDHAALEQAACEATAQNAQLIVAIPRQMDMLRQVIIELACLHEVEENTHALQGDKLAMREFTLRRLDCERRLQQASSLLLDPRPAPVGNACQWFWHGQKQNTQTPPDISRLLSRVCDTVYPYAPQIRNELIARPLLSSAGTAARTILLKRMATHGESDLLGISGFPPERSMYESVLRNTGLHRPGPEGTGCEDVPDSVPPWQWYAPGPDSPLHHIWQALDELVFARAGTQVPLKNIYAVLVQPPYGVPEGLLPVLLLAYYLTRNTELFLYREGSFLTVLDDAGIELLQRRPDLFCISGVRLDGERLALVRRYAAGLNVPATVPAVVSRLYAAVHQVPPLARNSGLLKANRGRALRDCFRAARSPERLLFEELPEAFGLPSMLTSDGASADAFVLAMRESMLELVNFAPSVRNRCRDMFLKYCGLPTGPAGWSAFLERAVFLAGRTSRGPLVPLLDRACRGDGNNQLEGMLGLIYGRSFDRWTDADIKAFAAEAHGKGELFRRIWDVYGSSFLNGEEQEARVALSAQWNKKIAALQGTYSQAVLTEALRDVLRQLEEEGNAQ